MCRRLGIACLDIPGHGGVHVSADRCRAAARRRYRHMTSPVSSRLTARRPPCLSARPAARPLSSDVPDPSFIPVDRSVRQRRPRPSLCRDGLGRADGICGGLHRPSPRTCRRTTTRRICSLLRSVPCSCSSCSARALSSTARPPEPVQLERSKLAVAGKWPGQDPWLYSFATETKTAGLRIATHRTRVSDLSVFHGQGNEKTAGQRHDLRFTYEPPEGIEPSTYALRDHERSCCVVPRRAVR